MGNSIMGVAMSNLFRPQSHSHSPSSVPFGVYRNWWQLHEGPSCCWTTPWEHAYHWQLSTGICSSGSCDRQMVLFFFCLSSLHCCIHIAFFKFAFPPPPPLLVFGFSNALDWQRHAHWVLVRRPRGPLSAGVHALLGPGRYQADSSFVFFYHWSSNDISTRLLKLRMSAHYSVSTIKSKTS